MLNDLDEILSDIADLVPSAPYGNQLARQRNKEFLEAIFWLAEHQGNWRALPARYQDRDAIYQRFNRWTRKGLWTKLFSRLRLRDDFPFVLDGSLIRLRNTDAKLGLRLTKRNLPRQAAHMHKMR
jgi:transposase